MKKLISLFILIFILASCGTPQPKLTREKWNKLSTRKYKVSADLAHQAIEKIFLLMDPDDVDFHYRTDGVEVTRKYSIYAVLAYEKGAYFYNFVVNENKALKETTISMQISHQSSTTGPEAVPTMSGNLAWTTSTTSTPGALPIDSITTYKLFWSRLDYLLKRTSIWVRCKDTDEEWVTKKIGDYSVSAICTNADDLLPENFRKVATQE